MSRPKRRTRRASRTGSIYKDGNGYRAQVIVGYNSETGDALTKKIRTATHAEAVEALAKLQHAQRAGKLSHGKSYTVAAFVDGWLKDKIAPFRAPKTHQQYTWVLNSHVLPILGHERLDQVKRADVQALVRILSKRQVKPKYKDEKKQLARLAKIAEANDVPAPALPERPLLSRRTIQSAVAVLHAAFEDAIKDGLCSVNPCDYIDLPKATRKPPQFLEPQHVEKLMQALADSPVRLLIRFMLATGVRSGEARGVRWQDLDLEKGTVRIAGQLQCLEGKLTYRPTTKTNQDRLLPIPLWLAAELRDLKAKQLVDGASDCEGIVFLNAFGRRIHERNLNLDLQAACRKAEIPIVSPHKLRHTAATLALMETGDLHAVQKMLGHQQVRLTSDLYGHATAESLRPVAIALGRIIEPETAS